MFAAVSGCLVQSVIIRSLSRMVRRGRAPAEGEKHATVYGYARPYRRAKHSFVLIYIRQAAKAMSAEQHTIVARSKERNTNVQSLNLSAYVAEKEAARLHAQSYQAADKAELIRRARRGQAAPSRLLALLAALRHQVSAAIRWRPARVRSASDRPTG